MALLRTRAGELLIDLFAEPPSYAFLSRMAALHPGKGYEEKLPPLRWTPSPRKTREEEQRPPFSPEVAAEAPLASRERLMLRVVVDYCNGLTQVEVASKYGLHVQTVRRLLQRSGVSMHDHRAALSATDLATIRIAHSRGVSLREFGRRYSVSHTTTLRRL